MTTVKPRLPVLVGALFLLCFLELGEGSSYRAGDGTAAGGAIGHPSV